jgi:hypothetical protein
MHPAVNDFKRRGKKSKERKKKSGVPVEFVVSAHFVGKWGGGV